LPESTSFTDVMSVQGGQRTFFTYAGASGQFGAEHVPFEKIDPQILHLGYFLLLQRVDQGEGIKILQEAKARGIATSIDLVSENSDRYPLVRPCLAYTDYLIVNEFEAGKLADMEPTAENLPAITQKLMDMGVGKMVVIHMPELAVCRSEKGYFTLGSHILPEGFIQGTTGAGDAFCAGALLGIYNGWSEEEILEFASCSAVMALRRPDATSGLEDAEKTRAFCKDFDRR
jgi:sugar/nucleoside kinase (ribokinase family)